MFSIFALLFLFAGVGLLSTGSFFAIPCIAAGLGGLYLADSSDTDFSFLGGVVLLVILAGAAYSIGRSVLGMIFGF